MTELKVQPVATSAIARAIEKSEPADSRDSAMKAKAREFESVFVAQMLSHSGLADALSSDSGFGGEAFSSLFVEQFADRLVERGGFGLTEKIYEQLREREGGDVDPNNA